MHMFFFYLSTNFNSNIFIFSLYFISTKHFLFFTLFLLYFVFFFSFLHFHFFFSFFTVKHNVSMLFILLLSFFIWTLYKLWYLNIMRKYLTLWKSAYLEELLAKRTMFVVFFSNEQINQSIDICSFNRSMC